MAFAVNIRCFPRQRPTTVIVVFFKFSVGVKYHVIEHQFVVIVKKEQLEPAIPRQRSLFHSKLIYLYRIPVGNQVAASEKCLAEPPVSPEIYRNIYRTGGDAFI